jgi:hypothetical protein
MLAMVSFPLPVARKSAPLAALSVAHGLARVHRVTWVRMEASASLNNICDAPVSAIVESPMVETARGA